MIAAAALLLAVAAAPAGSTAETGGADRVAPVVLVQTDFIPYVGADAAAAVGDQATQAGFRLRRARAGLDGSRRRWRARAVLELRAEGDTGQGGTPRDPDRPRVTEAFVRWQPGVAFHADVGSLRVPFSLSRQVDEADLRMAERPLSVQSIAPDFRVGAAAGGDLGLFQYAAGFFSNPSPLGDRGVVSSGLLAARLSAEPLGPVGVAPHLRRSSDPWWPWWRFAVGGSFFYDWRGGPDNVGIEGDAQIQRGRFAVTGEILWARRFPQRLGVVVEPGFFIWRDRFEVVARGEWFDGRYGLSDVGDAWVAAGGLAYHARSGGVLVQAMFHHRQDVHGDVPNDWALLRLSLGL